MGTLAIGVALIAVVFILGGIVANVVDGRTAARDRAARRMRHDPVLYLDSPNYVESDD